MNHIPRRTALVKLAAPDWLCQIAVALCLVIGVPDARCAEATEGSEADGLWEALDKAARPPQPPDSWQSNRPSREEIMQWRESQGRAAGEVSEKARDFYTRFPKHAKVGEAKQKEFELLRMAVQLGSTNRQSRLDEVETALLQDTATAEDTRFEIRFMRVQRAAIAKQSEGMPALMAELEKGARQLAKDYPKRDEPYEMLLQVASEAEPERSRAIAKELAEGSAPEAVQAEAKSLLKKLDALGKPLALSFKAVDGREIDVAKLKGKVVLVDFWATWCGPCVAELPNVKEAYGRLNPKGFEIVGISFDQDKGALEAFTRDKQMPWPQYFDGQGWQNKFGVEFGISGIPAMWLVDKKGVLRDMNAREGLAGKVEKLLAESP